MIITDLLPKAYVWGKTEKDIMVTMYFSIPSAFVNLRRPLLSLFKAGRGAPSSVCENPPSRSSERGILVHARKTIKIIGNLSYTMFLPSLSSLGFDGVPLEDLFRLLTSRGPQTF